MTEESLSALIVGLGAFIIVFALIFIAVAVILIIGKWKYFKKAGKGGWEAIIPFYSDWVLVETAGLEWYWFLAVIAPTIFSVLGNIISIFNSLSFVANIAMILGNVCIFYNISKRIHKDTAWIVLGTLFSPIMIAIAGFSSNITYDNTVEVTKNAFFDKKN